MDLVSFKLHAMNTKSAARRTASFAADADKVERGIVRFVAPAAPQNAGIFRKVTVRNHFSFLFSDSIANQRFRKVQTL